MHASSRPKSALALSRREVERSRQLAEIECGGAGEARVRRTGPGHERPRARQRARTRTWPCTTSTSRWRPWHGPGCRRHGSGKPEWLLLAPIAGRVLRVQQKSGGTVACRHAAARVRRSPESGSPDRTADDRGAASRPGRFGPARPGAGPHRSPGACGASNPGGSPRSPHSASKSNASTCWWTSSRIRTNGLHSVKAIDWMPTSKCTSAPRRCRFPPARCSARAHSGWCSR